MLVDTNGSFVSLCLLQSLRGAQYVPKMVHIDCSKLTLQQRTVHDKKSCTVAEPEPIETCY